MPASVMPATHAQPSGARAPVVDGREPNVAVAAAAAVANRRNGAHALLAAASSLVGLPAVDSKARALVLLLLLLLGCATVHLSMGGRRPRLRRSTVASSGPAVRVVCRSRTRLRWTLFHALLFLGCTRLLLGPRTAEPSTPQLLQVLVGSAPMPPLCWPPPFTTASRAP